MMVIGARIEPITKSPISWFMKKGAPANSQGRTVANVIWGQMAGSPEARLVSKSQANAHIVSMDPKNKFRAEKYLTCCPQIFDALQPARANKISPPTRNGNR